MVPVTVMASPTRGAALAPIGSPCIPASSTSDEAPDRSWTYNAGGMPPRRHKDAQSLCVLPAPGTITPRKHLESTISPVSVTGARASATAVAVEDVSSIDG